MTQPRGFGEGEHERFPAVALAREDAASFGGEAIAAAPALARPFDPAPEDPAALLELVEQGIERGDMEGQQPVRPPRDLARDVVAVELPVLERRQDQNLGAALARRRVC